MVEPVSTSKLIMTAAASTAVSTIQQAAQARAQARVAREQQEREIALSEQKRQVQEKRQREQARINQARARASFGARGVGSASGSANALVDGIAAQTEEEIAENRRLSDFGIENLRANQRGQERHNLLSVGNTILSSVVDNVGNRATSQLTDRLFEQ